MNGGRGYTSGTPGQHTSATRQGYICAATPGVAWDNADVWCLPSPWVGCTCVVIDFNGRARDGH